MVRERAQVVGGQVCRKCRGGVIAIFGVGGWGILKLKGHYVKKQG